MSKKDIIIVGASGGGRNILQLAKDCFSSQSGYTIKGFLDDNSTQLDKFDLEEKIIGSVKDYEVQENDVFLSSLGIPDVKKKLVESLEKRGARFISLVHPLAYVFPSAKIGKGCTLFPFSFLGPDAVLDDFSTLNVYSSCGHDSRVGKYTVFSPHAAINGFAVLEDEVFLGTHATVAPGKRVGKQSKLSAGAVVLNDIPSHSLVVGNPGVSRRVFLKNNHT